MRPYLVGGACHRVFQRLDESLSEGALALPTELAVHAERCPHCGPHVRETEALFQRLRSGPAGVDLGPVPTVVDTVLQQLPPSAPQDRISGTEEAQRRRQHTRWVLGQVAAIAAVLCFAIGSLTFLALKVNEAVSGISPQQVVQRWMEPLHDWSQALFHTTK